MDESQSVHSLDTRSGAGSSKNIAKPDTRPAIFLRGVSRKVAGEWFDEDEDTEKDEGLRIWVDRTVLISKEMRGFTWVWVSVVRPPGLQDAAEDTADVIKPALRIVAQIRCWEDPPDVRTAAASSQLCVALDASDLAGEMLRIEAAPPQASKSVVRSLKIFPFAASVDRQRDGFRFGNKMRADQHEATQKLLATYSGGRGYSRLLDGPVTDGMLLSSEPCVDVSDQLAWAGGIVKFSPPSGPPLDGAKSTRGWLLGSDRRLVVSHSTDSPKSGSTDRRLDVEISSDAINPSRPASRWSMGEPLTHSAPQLVGVDVTLTEVRSHVRHLSSTLITGGHGAGKTSLSQLVAHQLRRELFAHVVYFPCQSMINQDSRISTVKDVINRLFALAAWNARLGGQSLVILDDLDTLCPAETELEVGNENRNRQISEILRKAVQERCNRDTRVSLLAVAQSKDALHHIVVGGHVLQEYVHLQAPDKDKRRKILEFLAEHDIEPDVPITNGMESFHIDFLDVAGSTDGYMPGDLKLLVSRARSEALIRSAASDNMPTSIQLHHGDFESALKGFTPASLRNVTLQHSNTSFSSIGGLQETRKTLMETLQYPTLYAPIFAKCPLRLRSGLLLYGFPGCGKTLLASAVAGECGLNFISVKGPEILNKYIGASEKSVRDLFERAQAARPCVLFFDEFDSVAPKRGHDSTGVTDRVVNQLLTQMDGAEGLSGVYVLAATSRPDLIDPALLRPGRLDKSLICDMPNSDDRLDILRALSTKLRISADASKRLSNVAEQTNGYTGADLQAVIYNAHLEAIHDAIGDHHTQPKLRPALSSATKQNSTKKATSIPDFTYFRLGDNDGLSTSEALRVAERAEITQQLRTHKAAQHRVRVARRESMSSNIGTDEEGSEKAQGSNEPTIQWVHLERSLKQTRPSIAPQEVRRLDKIYREFVASRSGEMPSGQGGNEIGGRSSLM